MRMRRQRLGFAAPEISSFEARLSAVPGTDINTRWERDGRTGLNPAHVRLYRVFYRLAALLVRPAQLCSRNITVLSIASLKSPTYLVGR